MWAVFKREVRSYFVSPVGYVFIGLSLFLASIFFQQSIVVGREIDFGYLLYPMAVALVFLVPVLTMKLLAEERRTGTEQLLITSPRGITEIVLGKYLAAVFVFAVSVVFTLVYVGIILGFGRPELSVLANSYLGYLLIGLAYIAVGLFASSLTESQVISAILSFVFLFAMWVSTSLPGIGWLSLLQRYDDFLRGILSIKQVIYFLTFTGLFIFLTVRIIERRRWSQG